MARVIKKGSAIYNFLETEGLLVHGSKEEIEAAKKIYWSQIRKAWKQENRKSYKSYTIFFTPREQTELERKVITTNTSINQFIKNACMHAVLESSGIDKKTIGKVREALILFHSELQRIEDSFSTSENSIARIIERFIILENTILSILKHI